MKRIAFDVEDEDLRTAIEVYAKNRGLKVTDLARTALFQYIRRNQPSSMVLKKALQRIL